MRLQVFVQSISYRILFDRHFQTTSIVIGRELAMDSSFPSKIDVPKSDVNAGSTVAHTTVVYKRQITAETVRDRHIEKDHVDPPVSEDCGSNRLHEQL